MADKICRHLAVLGAKFRITETIDWADLILVMEAEHAEHIQTNYNSNPDKIKVLNIPDVYVRNDPELIQELKKKVLPILGNWDPRSNH